MTLTNLTMDMDTLYGDISSELNVGDNKEHAMQKIKNDSVVYLANNTASVPAIIRFSIDGKNNMKV